jgi:hypothetical protein
MKRVIATIATASGLMLANSLFAQDGAAPMPPLTAAQSQQVQSQMESYRRETDARVSRGEITSDEAQRLLQWREWQLAQLAAGLAPAPPSPPDRVVVSPPAYPAPPPRYYGPYPYYYLAPYYAPGPYYAPYYGPGWGLSVCAGRAYHHGFGSFCI